MRSTVRERAPRPHRLRAGDATDAPSGLSRLVLARCQGSIDATAFTRDVERWAATQTSVDDVVIRLLAAKRSARREFDLSAEALDNAVDPVLPAAVRAVTERALRSAFTDPVTGLRTRSSLAEEFRTAIEAAADDGTKLSVVLIDVDGLKRINDTHGHSAGDELLRSLGQAVKASLRARDTGYRFGGDEFLLLLPGLDEDDVASLRERLQLAGAPPISVGWATYPTEGSSAQELLDVADHRLYDAKQQRRRSRASAVVGPWRKHLVAVSAAAGLIGALGAGLLLWPAGTAPSRNSPGAAARPPLVAPPTHVALPPGTANPPAPRTTHVLAVRVEQSANNRPVVRAPASANQPNLSVQPAPTHTGLPPVTGLSSASSGSVVGGLVGGAVGTVGRLVDGALCLLGCP